MEGQVTRLFDIDDIAIPEELLQFQLDSSAVDARLQALSVSCAKETDVAVAEPGDIVHCAADAASYPDERKILLFTGLDLPGAEKAVKAAVGKTVGDTLETTIMDRPVKLVVQRIVHREPVAVNNELIAQLGLEGISTVADYRAQVEEEMAADQRMNCKKQITRYFMDRMLTESDFDYDAAEMDASIDAEMENALAEYAEAGIEATPEEIRASAILQAKQTWVAEAICKKHGIEIDMAALEEQADQMMEMMSLMGEELPDRAELIAMAYSGECMNGMFDYLDQVITEKMEAVNGNH